MLTCGFGWGGNNGEEEGQGRGAALGVFSCFYSLHL
jgi:hypothetical protein